MWISYPVAVVWEFVLVSLCIFLFSRLLARNGSPQETGSYVLFLLRSGVFADIILYVLNPQVTVQLAHHADILILIYGAFAASIFIFSLIRGKDPLHSNYVHLVVTIMLLRLLTPTLMLTFNALIN